MTPEEQTADPPKTATETAPPPGVSLSTTGRGLPVDRVGQASNDTAPTPRDRR